MNNTGSAEDTEQILVYASEYSKGVGINWIELTARRLNAKVAPGLLIHTNGQVTETLSVAPIPASAGV